jgi:hypothetical protein
MEKMIGVLISRNEKYYRGLPNHYGSKKVY